MNVKSAQKRVVRMSAEKQRCGRRPEPNRQRGSTRLLAVTLIVLLGACQQFPSLETSLSKNGAAKQSADQQSEPGVQRARGSLVEQAQRSLIELGYSVGSADGVVGPRTRKAVTAYQRNRGLPRDGEVTAGLIQSLRATLRAKKTSAPATAAEEQKTEPKRTSRIADLRLDRLPVYERGSTFVYSDGSVERVIAVKGSAVRWAGHDGTHFTADRNFLLPWSYWQTSAERGTTTLAGEPGSFWPLLGEQEIRYSVQVAVQNRADTTKVEQSTESWRCRLIGDDRLRVMAGTFETVVVGCDRHGGRDNQATRRVWHFAPDLGHYVRRDDVFDNPALDRTSELVAIQPAAPGWPPIARAALDRAVQQALEAAPDGAREDWSSSGVETRVTIQPAARFRRADGTSCRSYLQIWSGPEGNRHYPGSACLGKSGRWQIPGLDADPDAALAVSETHS